MLDVGVEDLSLMTSFSPSRLSNNEVTSTWITVLEGDFSNLIDTCTINIPQHPPTSFPNLETPQEYQEVWEQSCRQIHGHNLLAHLYWRFGWETGAIMSKLRKAGISWGTYTDELGFHCNAHPNNLVLISPSQQQTNNNAENDIQLLSPLDLDMAFFANESDTVFDLEIAAMRLALAGDKALNTGATGFAELGYPFEAYRWGFRDTMVKAFDMALNGLQDPHPPKFPYLVMHDLLRLALIVSCQRIA